MCMCVSGERREEGERMERGGEVLREEKGEESKDLAVM